MKSFPSHNALHKLFGRRVLHGAHFVCALLSAVPLPTASATEFRERRELLNAPASPYAENLLPVSKLKQGPLRTLQVEERAGVARAAELVRVPLFFADGECGSLDQLVLVAADWKQGEPTIVYQADDVRHGPNGGISRVHLWFAANLAAGEKKRFQLLRREGGPAFTAPENMRASSTAAGGLEIRTETGEVDFDAAGGIQKLSAAAGAWDFGTAAVHPHIVVSYPAGGSAPSREVIFDPSLPNAKAEVSWQAGPLFTKVQVRMAAEQGAAVEQTFRVPRHGREIVVTTAIFPGSAQGGVVTENQLLGSLHSDGGGGPPVVVHIPAGIRESLRAEHAYDVTALTTAGRDRALLSIPLVLGGTNGVWTSKSDGAVALSGHERLQQGDEGEKRTLFAYWTEVRLVLASQVTDEALWQTFREHVQPLVAVVDEPGITVEHLHAALREIVQEMKPIGWRQEAGQARVLGDNARANKILARVSTARDGDVENLLNGAKAARAKLTNNGQRKLRDDEKGRAYGGLDPYHITYTQSAAAALATLGDAPAPVSATNLAMARGVREFGGRTDDGGYPYIDCFNRTLNMQLGPVLFGITAGKEAHDEALVRFYRDLATAPAVKGVFGRGQRPYSGAPATTAEQTDYLYQSICDFWLRTTELLGNENFELHPLAYSRYTDCIDVMADLYHGPGPKPKDDESGQARANFFRGQAHTHRWLGWSCSPFIRLLEDPRENGSVGLTEAVYYARNQRGRWKNWPDLTFYILADLMVREGLQRYQPPTLPPAPTGLTLTRRGNAVLLAWAAVPEATSYRIYRASVRGGPYRWLNSPYLETPLPAVTLPAFTDEFGGPRSTYVVTAVNAQGRESAWATVNTDGSGKFQTPRSKLQRITKH